MGLVVMLFVGCGPNDAGRQVGTGQMGASSGMGDIGNLRRIGIYSETYPPTTTLSERPIDITASKVSAEAVGGVLLDPIGNEMYQLELINQFGSFAIEAPDPIAFDGFTKSVKLIFSLAADPTMINSFSRSVIVVPGRFSSGSSDGAITGETSTLAASGWTQFTVDLTPYIFSYNATYDAFKSLELAVFSHDNQAVSTGTIYLDEVYLELTRPSRVGFYSDAYPPVMTTLIDSSTSEETMQQSINGIDVNAVGGNGNYYRVTLSPSFNASFASPDPIDLNDFATNGKLVFSVIVPMDIVTFQIVLNSDNIDSSPRMVTVADFPTGTDHWRRVEIELTEFSGIDLGMTKEIKFFDFHDTNGMEVTTGTLFLDELYFETP